MRVHIFVGHPRPGSFCAALGSAYAVGARTSGCVVRELSLADMRFDADLHTVLPRQRSLGPDLLDALESIE